MVSINLRHLSKILRKVAINQVLILKSTLRKINHISPFLPTNIFIFPEKYGYFRVLKRHLLCARAHGPQQTVIAGKDHLSILNLCQSIIGSNVISEQVAVVGSKAHKNIMVEPGLL